jgi:hypothetical protein
MMALTLNVLNGTRQGCSCIKPLNNDSRTYVGASKQYYKGTGFAGCATIFVIGLGLGSLRTKDFGIWASDPNSLSNGNINGFCFKGRVEKNDANLFQFRYN